VRQLLAAWVMHDQEHLAQVNRVLAKQYHREVAPWRRHLPILHRESGPGRRSGDPGDRLVVQPVAQASEQAVEWVLAPEEANDRRLAHAKLGVQLA
jgi:hypothetical protein